MGNLLKSALSCLFIYRDFGAIRRGSSLSGIIVHIKTSSPIQTIVSYRTYQRNFPAYRDLSSKSSWVQSLKCFWQVSPLTNWVFCLELTNSGHKTFVLPISSHLTANTFRLYPSKSWAVFWYVYSVSSDLLGSRRIRLSCGWTRTIIFFPVYWWNLLNSL